MIYPKIQLIRLEYETEKQQQMLLTKLLLVIKDT